MRFLYLIIYIILLSQTSFSNEIFSTSEYELSFFSNNINELKEKKINEIKIKSLKNIFYKILTEDNIKKINYNDIDFVNSFILNYKINDEKIVNNNYFSRIKINFNENLIINYLVNNKIKFTDKLPDKFLILILEEEGLQKYLLTKENKFYQYLIKSNNKNFNNNYIIPKLDYNDRFIFNINHFIKEKFKQNNLINSKYKTEYQILIHVNSSNNFIISDVYLYLNNTKHFLKKIKINNNDYENFFKEVLILSTNKWKELNQIDTSINNLILCKININNIHELGYVRKLLKSNKLIKQINLKAIELNKNIYEIIFFGDMNYFQESLKNIRLNLSFYNNFCNIKLT